MRSCVHGPIFLGLFVQHLLGFVFVACLTRARHTVRVLYLDICSDLRLLRGMQEAERTFNSGVISDLF